MPTIQQVTDAVTEFIYEQVVDHNDPDLLASWHPEMETQIEAVKGTAGYNLHLPASDKAKWPHSKKPMYSLADCCHQIGMTGRNWVTGASEHVEFDFDSIADHTAQANRTSQPLDDKQRDDLIAKLAALPYVTTHKSTRGNGRHARVAFAESVPTVNRTEHTTLAKAVLAVMSADCGVELTASVDGAGCNRWFWSRRATSENDGFALISRATKKFDATRLGDWRAKKVIRNELGNPLSPDDPQVLFNADESLPFAALLEEDGFEQVDDDRWKRPGANGSSSFSITRFSDSGHESLVCFSSGVEGLDNGDGTGKPYSKSMYLEHFRFGGSKEKLYAWLESQGYTPSDPDSDFDVIETADDREVIRTPIDVAHMKQSRPWPDPLPRYAYDNPIGEYVLANDPNTEADPVAVLMQAWELIGNYFGRDAKMRLNHVEQFPNDNLLVLGESSLARKGTSFGDAAALFYTDELRQFIDFNALHGVSSGEGIVAVVQDPQDGLAVCGDGRRYILAEEFYRTITCMRREGNTLSAVLRQAFDNKVLQLNTKGNPMSASRAHISMITHCTIHEFNTIIRPVDLHNGFLNRIQFCLAKRSKLLPSPKPTEDRVLLAAATCVQEAREWLLSHGEGREFSWSPLARARYEEFYCSTQHEARGPIENLTSRAATHVIRSAIRHAAIGKRQEISPEDLEAALAIWEYTLASAKYVLDDLGQSDKMVLFDALCVAGVRGMSRTQIRDLFHKNKNRGEIDELLHLLAIEKMARGEQIKDKSRTVEKWFAIQQ